MDEEKQDKLAIKISIIISVLSWILWGIYQDVDFWMLMAYGIIACPILGLIVYVIALTLISIFDGLYIDILRERDKKEQSEKEKFLKYYIACQYDDAIKQFHTVNNKAYLFDKVAYCYLAIGNYEQSIKIYDEELKIYPNNKKAFYNRAIAKYKLNSTDTKDLLQIYSCEQPFVVLNKEMNLQFKDKEQQEAQRKKYYNKTGNFFGTYNLFIYNNNI